MISAGYLPLSQALTPGYKKGNDEMETRKIDVVFFAKHGAADLYKNTENGRIYARMPASSKKGQKPMAFWTTTSPTGGYEPDCPIKSGIIMNVVDSEGCPLFEEQLAYDEWNGRSSAEKIGKFSYEDERDIARQWAQEHGLHTYEEWKRYVCADMPDPDSRDTDTWLYTQVEYSNPKILKRLQSLGRDVAIKEECAVHKISKKTWESYYLMADDDITLEICGFSWEEE